MITRLFGNFLLSEGVVDVSGLASIMDKMETARPMIGVIALSNGLMTAEQVLEINHRQKNENKRFGELAVETGYLTEDKLKFILESQKNEMTSLGQVLVDEKIFSYKEFVNFVVKYKKMNSVSDEEISILNSGNVDMIIKSYFKKTKKKIDDESMNMFSIMVKNIIRFVDSTISVDMPNIRFKPSSQHYIFSQKLNIGNVTEITSSLIADKKTFVEFSTKFSKFEIKRFDTMTKDSIGEFLNLSNGIFAVNKSNEGVESTMCPQNNSKFDKEWYEEAKKIVLPIVFSSGILWIGIEKNKVSK